jgi:pimeloyl-ACP methyl ester carboxylesterase
MAGNATVGDKIERRGSQIRFWLSGPEERPHVVFTHGMTIDHEAFAAQVEPLAEDYRILTWDVRGHGLSQPIGEAFSIGEAVEDLVAVLDQVGCHRAAFVGHSMGGYIIQELAFRYPERVLALVSIGSTCITLKQPAIVRSGALLTPMLFRLGPEAVLWFFISRFSGVSSETRAYVAEACRRVSKKEIVSIWGAITDCYHYEPDYRITHPLLLTHGRYDSLLVPRLLAPTWAERDTGGHYVEIPQAGHNAHQDNPDFFNDLLLDFLRKNLE